MATQAEVLTAILKTITELLPSIEPDQAHAINADNGRAVKDLAEVYAWLNHPRHTGS